MIDTQFDQYLGSDNFLDEDDAISRLFHHVFDPAMCIYECPLRVFKECQNLPKRLDIIGFSLDRDLSDKEFATVDAKNLWTLLNEGKHEELPELIDVREPREFRNGHIYGALSIPLPLIASLDPALPKDGPIVLICRSSRRSRQAAAIMEEGGFTKVSILDGGMLAWESAGLLEAVDIFSNPDQTNKRAG